MKKTRVCQSCAMPLVSPTLRGTYKNGNKTNNYCKYCFSKGSFITDCTMEEMIEICIPYYIHKNPYENEAEAREYMPHAFSKLKRWKQGTVRKSDRSALTTKKIG